MKKKSYFLPILSVIALCGIGGGLYMGHLSSKEGPVQEPAVQPTLSPYVNFIAGNGIVESPQQNTQVGSSAGGLVTSVPVKLGEVIKKGTVLVKVDCRVAEADVKVKAANVTAARTAVSEAKASLKTAQDQYELVTQISDKRAISRADFLSAENAVFQAQAATTHAKSLLKVARAELKSSRVNVNLCTIRSPIEGHVLQINTRPGQYAPTSGTLQTPLMLIGPTHRYDVRVEIDEADAWRFKLGAEATAYVRGNPDFSTKLTYVYVEPYVVPKKTLNGDATELVDTRVLQIVYSFNPKAFPVYLGQQLDVYIKADPVPSHIHYDGPREVSR